MRRKLFRSFLPVLLISAVFHFPIASSFARAHSFQRSVVLSTSSSGAMSSSAMSSPETPTQNTHTIDTEEREEPVWDPVAQIYVGGKVPENAEVAKMIQDNHGALRLFGYGSLCWNPGTGPLADPTVEHTLGRARGYRRCWAQRSTDHRGSPSFPGIVCTLLKDEEYRQIRELHSPLEETLTEGLIYTVPPELVDGCLEDLDFREKGGYARDIIEVVEGESGKTVQALLYRGTPDNPAFWPRVLRDLPFAAAVIAAAKGPSGRNEVYLNRLDDFLKDATTSSVAELEKFDDTVELASMEKSLRDYNLHFMFGSGSNQHNQLLLASETNAAGLVNGEDAREMKDMVLCTPPCDLSGAPDPVQQLFAGGGHSAILTESGRLFLFGWNESGQLGTSGVHDSTTPVPLVSALEDIIVETAALGFNHSLVIEKDTGRLLAFGDNSRGQVDGTISSKPSLSSEPVTPEFLRGEHVVHAAAGLFHSAVVTREGELVTFGCGRFGQCLSSVSSDPVWIGRWKPNDGSKLIQVGCGRRHTTVLDDKGRIWSFGDNKYGQLGRSVAKGSVDVKPRLVDITQNGWNGYAIRCGWSHTIVVAKDTGGSTAVFGWGRGDKGQLGTGRTENGAMPLRLFGSHTIESVACGSESTIVLDASGDIWCCGWNEHGNLSSGGDQDLYALSKVVGAPITTTPGYPSDCHVSIAAGGAHLLAMKVSKPNRS